MKPIIGIIGRPEVTRGHNEVMVLYESVRKAIVQYGAVPLGIVPTTLQSYLDKKNSDVLPMNEDEKNDYDILLRLCDGLILPGGDEVMDYDFEVIRYAKKAHIPLLGICMGMQAMGLESGGQLKPVVSYLSHRKKKQDYAHSVNISPASFLYQIVGKKQIEVNSFHQFTVIDPKLDVVGTSPDGLIEAIEDKTHPFFVGVQWHPESILEYDIVSQQLFQSFFDAVKKR